MFSDVHSCLMPGVCFDVFVWGLLVLLLVSLVRLYKKEVMSSQNHFIVWFCTVSMARQRTVTKEEIGVILHLKSEGKSFSEIAKVTKRSRKAVTNIIKRHEETGSTDHRPRSGRPSKSTPRDDRKLIRLSLANRHKNASDLRKEWSEQAGVDVSSRTVRRRLCKGGLKGCKARRKPLLTAVQRKRRLEWCRAHKSWSLDQWKRILFSDESTFTLQSHAGNNWVRRRQGEEYKPECILPTIKHPPSLMIWGCMAAHGVGRFHIVDGMMNGTKYRMVLEEKMLRSARDLFADGSPWFFQDDNAPCHRAKLVKKWLEDNGVTRIDWPAQSPDLNPIENLWHRIGVIVSREKPKTKRELTECLIAAWHRVITPAELEKLVSSMPRRIAAVIANKGWPSKY